MKDKDIARVLAIASEMAGDNDLTVIPTEEPEPQELFGGLTPQRSPDYNAYQDYIKNKPHKVWRD
jgi:hypothetical protein